MRNLIRRSGFVALVTFAALFIASAASAGSIHLYGELMTSNQFGAAPNIRGQLDVGYDFDANDIMLNGNISYGDGIGNGYVPHNGWVTYEHRFEPAAIVDNILGAGLYIATWDDMRGRRDIKEIFEQEAVAITLDGEFWNGGWATYRIFDGWVAASLFEDDGEMVVRVASRTGDVIVGASLFKVLYESDDGSGGGTSAVPEPGAAMLFCAGLGVVGVATRRRS